EGSKRHPAGLVTLKVPMFFSAGTRGGRARQRVRGLGARIPVDITISMHLRCKDDPSSLGTNTARGCFQHTHHTDTHLPVADRRLALTDALREMGNDPLQGFSRLHVRAPDVARSIADLDLANLLNAGGDLDAPVVDLDGLTSVQLVEDEALP